MNHIQVLEKKRRTYTLIIVAMLVAVVVAGIVCLFIGSSNLSVREAVDALLGRGTNAQSRIIWRIRVPRVLAAIIAGAGLSVAGLIMQTTLNNTMAAPSTLGVSNSWLAFFWALPADAIVVLSLRSAWRDFRSNRTLISVLMWGCLLAIYMMVFVLMQEHVWRIFLLGIPGQAAIWLWFRMYRSARTTEVKDGQEGTEKKDS